MDTLRRGRELVTINAPVDARFKLADIHRRVIAAGGPDLLFNRVEGSPFPVVTNLFGSTRRVGLASGPRPEAFVRDAVHAAETIIPPTLGKICNLRGLP